MARGNQGDTADVDVDTNAETDVPTDAAAEVKESKSTRPAVPEGYITPVGFAKKLTEKFGKEVPPQYVYSTIKNAPKDHPFPIHSAGGRENLIVLSEGMTWWEEKLARAAEREQNKAKKEAEKAEKAQKRAEAAASGETVSEGGEPAVEAE